MSNDFDKILDECIDLISSGETLESCLDKYPEYSGQLEPMLAVFVQTRDTLSFEVNIASKEASRNRFDTAVSESERQYKEKQNILSWLFGSAKIWAPIVTVIVIALVSLLSLRPVLFPEISPAGPLPGTVSTPVPASPQPGATPTVSIPEPSTSGNFVFLISDDVNAIDDFKSLKITIEKIGLARDDQEGHWIEFSPEVAEVDITQVRDDKAQQIWQGNIDDGQYSKVFIQVSEINGILLDTDELVSVKLPSEKLQISVPFEINSDTTTNFVFDVTVIATGNEQNGIKYILKPVVEGSGADQKFERVEGNAKRPSSGQTFLPQGHGKKQ